MNFLSNELKIYFGDDFQINKYITLHHPKVGDIVEMGEGEYFGTAYTLAAVPSDMKPQLWDIGLCWEEIDEFDFFYLITRNLTPDMTRVFFGELDFTKFNLAVNQQTEEIVMVQPHPTENDVIVITRYDYLNMVEAIRKIHQITPKREKAATKTVRDILIDEDRKRLKIMENEEHESQMILMISSLTNCSEFKYGLREVRDMPLYAFMDSINRIQLIKSASAMLQGCYSGMIDTSKINKKDLNWMRSYKK